MPVSEKTFERLALEDGDDQWELHCGRLRRKPAMTHPHNSLMNRLGFALAQQLDENVWEVRINSGHARTDASFYVPDVMVLPRSIAVRWEGSDRLETYPESLPFVAEVWSKSTGDYDVEEKFPQYQRRQDREIWRIHPQEKTVVIWRRQPDGRYDQQTVVSGVIELYALPGVIIDLASLFKFVR